MPDCMCLMFQICCNHVEGDQSRLADVRDNTQCIGCKNPADQHPLPLNWSSTCTSPLQHISRPSETCCLSTKVHCEAGCNTCPAGIQPVGGAHVPCRNLWHQRKLRKRSHTVNQGALLEGEVVRGGRICQGWTFHATPAADHTLDKIKGSRDLATMRPCMTEPCCPATNHRQCRQPDHPRLRDLAGRN